MIRQEVRPTDTGPPQPFCLGTGTFVGGSWAKRLLWAVAISFLWASLGQGCQAQEDNDSSDKPGAESTTLKPANTSAVGTQRQSVAPDPESRSTDHENSIGVGLAKHILNDQVELWTFPRHLSWEDADILVPFGMALGGTLATDSDFSRNLSNSPSRLNNSVKFSNYGIGVLGGFAGGAYLLGQFTHDDHKKETGILASEAALNAYLITTGLKYGFGRLRPLDDPQYSGDFRHGGSSMPSEHASVAWAIASVFAHEYPGPLTSFLAY
jgi:hypothetical protein